MQLYRIWSTNGWPQVAVAASRVPFPYILITGMDFLLRPNIVLYASFIESKYINYICFQIH